MKRNETDAHPDAAPAASAGRPAREPVVLALDALAPHPRQEELFADLPDADLALLAADIAKRGLQDPVEVTPNRVIIAGHQRVRAARRLGWAEVPCVVRHDLAAEGTNAEFAHFVGSNVARRHMTPLARARCMAAVLEAEIGRRVSGAHGCRERMKAIIAAQFDVSPRTLNRLLALLRAPREVQDAHERKELSLADAGRGGKAPAAGPKAGLRYDKAYRRVTGVLSTHLRQFEARPDWLDRTELAADADLLDRAARVFAELADRGRAHAAAAAGEAPLSPEAKELIAGLRGGRPGAGRNRRRVRGHARPARTPCPGRE